MQYDYMTSHSLNFYCTRPIIIGILTIDSSVVMKISLEASLKSDLYFDAIMAEFAAAGMAATTTGITSVIPLTPKAFSPKKTSRGMTTSL